MLFTLKKYIGGMMLPLPLLLLCIALGLGLLWFSRHQKSGKILVTAGWLALTLHPGVTSAQAIDAVVQCGRVPAAHQLARVLAQASLPWWRHLVEITAATLAMTALCLPCC